MAFKLVAFAAFLAAASAGVIPAAPVAYHAAAPAVYAAAPAPAVYAAAPAPAVYAAAPAPLAYAAPVAKAVVTKAVDAEYDPNPQYSYNYDVQDSLTGDNKQQQETRNGDSVQGSYSFIEADGTRRIVEYTADPVNGFNAVVHKEPASVAVKTVTAPVAHAAIAPAAYYSH